MSQALSMSQATYPTPPLLPMLAQLALPTWPMWLSRPPMPMTHFVPFRRYSSQHCGLCQPKCQCQRGQLGHLQSYTSNTANVAGTAYELAPTANVSLTGNITIGGNITAGGNILGTAVLACCLLLCQRCAVYCGQFNSGRQHRRSAVQQCRSI
jgi:hypothetical protein